MLTGTRFKAVTKENLNKTSLFVKFYFTKRQFDFVVVGVDINSAIACGL